MIHFVNHYSLCESLFTLKNVLKSCSLYLRKAILRILNKQELNDKMHLQMQEV